MRLIFSKTGNERIIRAWDENFYYSMIKDTSKFGLKGISVKFKIDTSKTGTIKFQSIKNEDVSALNNPNMANGNFHFSRPVFILKKERNRENITEQILSVNKSGDFQIYQVTTGNFTEKPRSDIFYHGKYFFSSDSDSIYFKGKISGLPSKKPGKKEFPCNLKLGFNSTGLNLEGFPSDIMFDFPDQAVLNIKSVDPSVNVDIPYASTKNITKQKLYSCNKCFLRYLVLKKMLKIRNEVRKYGLDIKLLDCYRPFDVQKLLYEVFPVKGYVADPVGGSIHNRGTAIDVTLTDLAGNDLDMGSGYDEFSPKSHYSYQNLPDSILNRRLLLHKIMINNNFVPIRMEWWHFEDVLARKYKNMNDPFPCGNDW
jgi:D-alanyl-D-alanine dipeptidase